MKSGSYIEPLEARIAPAVIFVNSDLDTPVAGKTDLRQALAAADTKDVNAVHSTIMFKLPANDLSNGAYTITLSQGLVSTGNVSIVGPGAGKLIINGSGSQIFRFYDTGSNLDRPVTISGMSLINGVAVIPDGGGAVFSNESLTLSGMNFANNSSPGQGGAVTVAAVSFSMMNCIVSGNTAQGAGGGVYASTTKTAEAINSTISGNKSAFDAGGIKLESAAGKVIVSGDKIVNNTATSVGGGALLEGTVGVVNSIFSGNTASKGGGIYFKDFAGFGGISVTGSSVRNNSAGTGAGMSIYDSKIVSLTAVTVTGNRTGGGKGGGLYLNGPAGMTLAPATISGSHFNDNTAGGNGGGVFATAGIKLSVSGTTVDGNNAGGGGGGMMVTGSTSGLVNLQMSGGQVSNNTSSGVGGGMYVAGDGTVTITGTAVSGNESNASAGGGGLCINSTVAVKLAGIIVTGNDALGNNSGGGLNDNLNGPGSTLTITGGVFSGNFAGANGGGIETFGTGLGKIIGATITGNLAASEGGGILNLDTGMGVKLTGGVVSGNTAVLDPNSGGV